MARNPLALDWAPITNALDGWQKQRNNDREFEARNYLAQEQLGIQKQNAARQQAEYDRQNATRGEVTNWLASNPNVGGVPQPLVELSRIQGDASPVQQYLLAEAKRKATLSGPEEYGKSGAVFQGPDGNFYTVQFGSRGQRSIQRVEAGGQPLTPAKGVGVVGDEMYDSATGQTVRSVAPQLAGKKRAEEMGEASGKAAADYPRIAANAVDALKTIDQIRGHPGKTTGIGAIGGLAPAIPGTSQAGFVDLVDQAKGKAFLEAFNSLKGGGQITEAEGRKATEAIARLNRARRVEDFDKALQDFEDVVKAGAERARRAAQPPATSGGISIRRLD
jgi:hypothetical protein